MKRFLFAISVGLLTIFSGVLLNPSSASAVSPWDNIIQTTDNLRFHTLDGEKDWSLSWSLEYLYALENGCDNWPGSLCDAYAAYQDFDFATGSVFVEVSEDRFNPDNPAQFRFLFSDSQIVCNPSYLNGIPIFACTSDTTIWNITCISWSNQRDQAEASQCSPYTTNPYRIVSYPGNNRELYYTTAEFNYPPDYEGQLAPDEIPGGTYDPEREVIAPDFDYSWDNLTITATDKPRELPEFIPDDGYTFQGYEIAWSLMYCEGEFDQSPGSPRQCSTGWNMVNLTHLPQEGTYTYETNQLGTYRLEAEYRAQQCYRYPSYPATPDYCFYTPLMTHFKLYTFESRAVAITLDGSSGSGTTDDLECDVSGWCKPSYQTNCFNNEFPYVDLQACIEGVTGIVGALTFDRVTLIRINNETQQCTQLNTIGGWMFTQGQYVCPQVPEYVRNVVTPFITVALGLLIARFILRIGKDVY